MFENQQDIFDWISDAEGELNHAMPEYRLNREYYEHKQKPSDVPNDISYIVKNMIMPHVNLQISKVLGGKVSKELSGDPAIVEPMSQLLEDVVEKNKFLEEILPSEENYRQVEGLGGFRVVFDMFEDGPYGLGMPRIYTLDPQKGEILLDPNASNGFHNDDRARAVKKRVLLEEAKKNPRWAKHKDMIGSSASNRYENDHGQELKIDLYDIEFKKDFYFLSVYDPDRHEYFPIEEFRSNREIDQEIGGENPQDRSERPFLGEKRFSDQGLDRARGIFRGGQNLDQRGFIESLQGHTVVIKKTIMFECKVVNYDLLVEEPEPTGFADFTIIPAIHTVRSKDHKYPSSPVMYLRNTQDRINGTSSMMYLEAKRGVKNLHFIRGMTQKEFQRTKRVKTDAGEFIFSDNPNADIKAVHASSLSPAMLQQLELDMQAFELIGNTNEPDRGQPVDLSGKAIVSLQARADIPLYVSVTNLENALVEVFRRLIEGFQKFMDKPFMIEREIEGQRRKIFFNTDVNEITDSNDKNLFIKGGVINPLDQMHVPKIAVDIMTNTLQKEAEDANKAFAMFQAQQLADIDLHKAIYPKKWSTTLTNAREFNQAMQMVQAFMQLSPDAQQIIAEQMQQVAQAEQQLQQLTRGKR